MIAIYIIYTMLPIRLREAIVGGTLLSLSHIVLTFYMNDSDDDNEVVSVVGAVCHKYSGACVGWIREGSAEIFYFVFKFTFSVFKRIVV